MRRDIRMTLGTSMVVGGLLLAGCGGGEDGRTSMSDADPTEIGATSDTATGSPALIATAQGSLGAYLTTDGGGTLYLFTEDSPGASSCIDSCLSAWPALLTDGEPVAGTGVDAGLVGTLSREDGTVQVTYGGWPLYRYVGDAEPGDTTGQGVGGVWFIVSPTGEMLSSASEVDTGPRGDEDASEPSAEIGEADLSDSGGYDY